MGIRRESRRADPALRGKDAKRGGRVIFERGESNPKHTGNSIDFEINWVSFIVVRIQKLGRGSELDSGWTLLINN
jgi:hypothetical protein